MHPHLEMVHLYCLLTAIINQISQFLVVEGLGFIHFHFYKIQTFEFKTERLLTAAKIVI